MCKLENFPALESFLQVEIKFYAKDSDVTSVTTRLLYLVLFLTAVLIDCSLDNFESLLIGQFNSEHVTLRFYRLPS